MAGLLYKDFVGIKGKIIVMILGLATIFFLVVRIIFPGGTDGRTQYANEFVSDGEVNDIILMLCVLMLIFVGFFMISSWTVAICRNDEKCKARQFVNALPLAKNSYIASKYIFIAIAVYVMFSLEQIWTIIFSGMAGENGIASLATTAGMFLTSISSASMLLAAIELPFYFTFGVKKGSAIKVAILCLLFFAVAYYMMFGDLSIIENWDIYVLVEWTENHMTFMSFLSVISPIVVLAIYWISYRLTCWINRNREVDIDG